MTLANRLAPRLTTLRFRLYFELYRSELAGSLIGAAQRGKALIKAVVANPRNRLSRPASRAAEPTAAAHRGSSPAPRPAGRSASSALPIIFIHQSNSDYLRYTFAQARQSNPESKIYLLGDASNRGHRGVEHHLMTDYFEQAAAFRTVYKHFSTHSFEFELINFQRWFILEEFLVAQGLERCLYLDSDTLLYTDVTEDSIKFADVDFTLSQMTSGCTFFLNRVAALTDFCQFLFDVYAGRDKYSYDKMIAHFTARRMNGLMGGVCDMTALQLYHELHFGEIGEAGQVIDGSLYDPAITSAVPGLEMADGLKKITWRDGLPYGQHARTGKEIRFNSLQFQGRTKHLMSQFYTGTPD